MRLSLAIGRLMRANICLSVYHLYMRMYIYTCIRMCIYVYIGMRYIDICYTAYVHIGVALLTPELLRGIKLSALCHCDRLMKEMNVVVGSFWSRCPGQGMNEGSHIQVLCGICALVW